MRKGWTAGLVLMLVAVAAGCGEPSDEEAREETINERPVSEWLADLKSGEPDARVHAARILRTGKSSPLVRRELIAALEDENFKVRTEVGRALQRLAEDHEDAAVALARAIRDDPGGAGDIFWMRGADGAVTSPVAIGVLVEILQDPNLHWETLEKAAKMLHAADEEIALAALPDDLSPEQREALVLLVEKGPAFRLVRAVEQIIGDHVRSDSEFISRSSDGLLDTNCAKDPFTRERRDPGRIQGKIYSTEEGAVPRYEVTAVDAETDEPVAVTAVFLKDGRTGKLRSLVSGGTWSSKEPPRAGDELGIYARGHELAWVMLAGAAGTVDARLQKAKGNFVVGPVRPLEDVGEVRAQLVLTLVHMVDGKKKALIRDSIAVEFGPDGTASVPIPEGFEAAVYIDTPGDALVWPRVVRAVPGRGVPISVERPRRTEIILPGEGFFGEPALSMDLTADPGWPKHKVDSFTSWRVSHEPVFVVREERLFLDAPDAGWHLFARWEGRRFYLRIPAGAKEVPIPLEPVKTVAGRPVVDGEPVPELTILAPGWLDLDTIRGIGVRGHRAEGYSHAVHAGSRWGEVSLPHAEWLTAWHPEKGIAWLEWIEGDVPTGQTLPGRIEVRGEPGERLTGTARIHPSWPAAGTISVGSTFEPLERSYEKAEVLVFPGLPPGNYRVYVRVSVESEGAEPTEVSRSFFAPITEDDAVQVYAPDGRRR